MSRACNQSLALLTVVANCFRLLRQGNCFARLDMRELVARAEADCVAVIEAWPATGSEEVRQRYIRRVVHGQWKRFVEADNDRDYGAPTLAAICERILADLEGRLRDRQKLALLGRLTEPAARIHDWLDPEGRNFVAYQKSDYLLDELYRLVGWEQ